jgi:hypothetical protein
MDLNHPHVRAQAFPPIPNNNHASMEFTDLHELRVNTSLGYLTKLYGTHTASDPTDLTHNKE